MTLTQNRVMWLLAGCLIGGALVLVSAVYPFVLRNSQLSERHDAICSFAGRKWAESDCLKGTLRFLEVHEGTGAMPVLTEKKRDGKSVWVWNYSEDWEQTEKRAIVEAYNARMRGLLSASQ